MIKYIEDQYRNTNIETFGNNLEELFNKIIIKPIDDFYTDCYNLDTAKGEGLDKWGELLDFPRYIKNYIGSEPFYRLEDDQYRKILKIKAIQRRGNVTIGEINTYMDALFKTTQGSAYIIDPQDMTFVTYVFDYQIESWLWFVFNNYDILPRPGGVGAKVTENVLFPFAFEGQAESNFYNVNFQG